MKTYNVTASEIQKDWWLVNADGKTLGRLATEIASVLRGKHKPTFTPHLDNGDFIVVVNAAKIRVTGNKEEVKRYYSHSGYPGGLSSKTIKKSKERLSQRGLSHMLLKVCCHIIVWVDSLLKNESVFW